VSNSDSRCIQNNGIAATLRFFIAPSGEGGMVPKEIKERFASTLRTLVQARGWNQSDLGRESGIGRDCISGYVRAKNMPNTKHMDALASALQVTRAMLMGDPPAPTQQGDGNNDILKIVPLPGETGRSYIEVRRVVSSEQAIQIVAILASERYR
jgi:transcriptional regulator with XRE-family HTH domain